jgi:16S rRNA (cytosine1402-N4)-methyltransferase
MLNSAHISVLLHELVESIEIFNEKKNIIVDCTLWLWWHASEIIQKMHQNDIFIWFDADEINLGLAKERLLPLAKKIWVELHLIRSNFVHLKEELSNIWIEKITGIYFDLWISSLHIDDGTRGFSIKHDGPLDMRFDKSTWQSASDVVNYYDEKRLTDIFTKYGEEPNSRKIAKYICEKRKQKALKTTYELRDTIDEVTKFPWVKEKIFQAIRIEVNKELEYIERALKDAINILDIEGNIFVISFHSLEDRIVKNIFRDESRDCICSDFICTCKHKKTIKILTPKPILPSEKEINENIRSRSAKARAAKKITF